MSASEHPSLDGRWKLIRAELDGEEAPIIMTMKTEMKIQLATRTYEMYFACEVTDRGSIKLGTTIDAHKMFLKGTEGTNAGRAIPCIYQLTRNRLRICYGLDGVVPTKFMTAPGQHRYLAIYRRIP